MAAIAFTTGISPAGLLAAPPEVFDALVTLWEDWATKRARKSLRDKYAGRFGRVV